jgi:hypothetical protein
MPEGLLQAVMEMVLRGRTKVGVDIGVHPHPPSPAKGEVIKIVLT